MWVPPPPIITRAQWGADESWAGRSSGRVTWDFVDGPLFHNGMAQLTLDGRSNHLVLERAAHDDDGNPVLEVAAERELAVTAD